MISLLGTNLGAATPWILVAAPLAAALLVYVYRTLGTSTHAVVSTLFLLRSLPNRTVSRKRFVPPIQFWIELAAFVLLSSAGAGMFLAQTGSTVAVVVDLSLSMDAPTIDGIRRIDAAKRLAAADISQSLPTTRFALFAAHSSLKPLAAQKLSAVEAAATLSTVSVVTAEDRLQLHLAALLGSGDYDSVWVYTDRPLADSITAVSKVRVISVAADNNVRARGNLWIRGVSSKRVEGKVYLSVSLQQTGIGARTVSVSATCYEAVGDAEFRPRMLPDLRVEAPEGVSTTVEVGPVEKPYSYCRIRAISESPQVADLLAQDNEAWIAADTQAASVALIGPLSAQGLKIGQIGDFVVADLASTAEGERGQLAMIVHRTAIPEGSRTATLVVAPPEGELPWGGTVRKLPDSAPQISRWDNAHPVMRYVNPTLLNVQETRIIECPPSGSAVLTTTAGAIVCVGEHQGARYAILGFELFPFEGSKTPTLSIFTLNLFKWLFEAQAASQRFSPYEVITLPRDVSAVNYIAPTTDPLPISEQGSIVPPQLGVLRLKDADGLGFSLMQVNLFSDHESDLSLSAPLALSYSEQSRPPSPKESFDMTGWFTALAVLVLLLDLILRIVRKSRWSRT